VIEAVDGAESVAKAASERPDLVLMDIQLPVLDGYDATRQIKALPRLAAIPIIAVSSFAMKGDEEKARASGCDDSSPSPCQFKGSETGLEHFCTLVFRGVAVVLAHWPFISWRPRSTQQSDW